MNETELNETIRVSRGYVNGLSKRIKELEKEVEQLRCVNAELTAAVNEIE